MCLFMEYTVLVLHASTSAVYADNTVIVRHKEVLQKPFYSCNENLGNNLYPTVFLNKMLYFGIGTTRLD